MTAVVGDHIDTRRMTGDTIEFALDHHTRRGVIKGWWVNDIGRWIVVLAGSGPLREIEARTKREVGILLAALSSAEHAPQDRV